MNRWRDIIDWVGGFPYEVATADEIFEFYKAKGYTLLKMKTGGVGWAATNLFSKKNQKNLSYSGLNYSKFEKEKKLKSFASFRFAQNF